MCDYFFGFCSLWDMAVNDHPGTVVSAIFALISGLVSASIAAFMVTRTIKNSRAVTAPHLDRLDKTVKIYKDYPDGKFLQGKGKSLKEKLLDSIEIYSKRSLFEASIYTASHGNKRVLKYFDSYADSLIYGKVNPSPPLFWNFAIIILGPLLSSLYLLSSLFFILSFIDIAINLKLGDSGFSGGDLIFIAWAYILNSTAFMFCNYLIYKVFPWHAVVKSSYSESLSMFNLKFSDTQKTFLLSELSYKLINFEFLENLIYMVELMDRGVDKFLNRNKMKACKNLNLIWFFPLILITILPIVFSMFFANLLIYPIKYLFYAIVK
ncbi:hypothetical protein [Rothia nasimurium]|uniref:hypothetical protein n=1 Tax=Rothia nasimurium TaxID=85336 RepID=UPI001F414AF1|nr:hypothetical protein [Rothia nasimurium]